jgi:choline dehydrogenase-like flavoprotein
MGTIVFGSPMISYLESLQDKSKLRSDICIVGTGPAGITLAKELIDSGLKVAILESGDFEFDPDTQNLYAGEIVDNLPPVPLDVSRLRYFGGTSNHWEGVCGPFDPIDFRARDWIPNSGWPLTRGELDPFYKKAQQLIGLGPYEYRSSAWSNENWDLFDIAGTDIAHAMRQSYPQRFGPVYQKDLEKAENVHVILNANLTGIRTNEAFDHVTAVEATALGGKSITIDAKNVVLACGGVENARLLLAFGFNSKLPALGRYFNFHPHLLTGQLLLERPILHSRFPYRWHDINDTKIMHQFLLSEQVQEREKLPNHAATIEEIRLPYTKGYSSAKRLYSRLRGTRNFDNFLDDLYDLLTDLDGAYTQWNRRHAEHQISLLNVETYLEQSPHPDSRIFLSEDKDALGMPRAKIDWAYFADEPARVQRFNELLALSFGAAGIGRMKIFDNMTDPANFEELVREQSTGEHQIGATRMSEDPESGVVDSNCTVHGFNNLFCAGSSVFSTASWINPTTTIVALAVRLAEHLQSHLVESA